MEKIISRPFVPKNIILSTSSRKTLHHYRTCRNSYVKLINLQAKSYRTVNQTCTFSQMKQLRNEYKAVQRLLSTPGACYIFQSPRPGHHCFYSTNKEEGRKNDDKKKISDEEERNEINQTTDRRLAENWAFILATFGIMLFLIGTTPDNKSVSYEAFVENYLLKGKVKYVTIHKSKIFPDVEVPQATLYPEDLKMVEEKLTISMVGRNGFEKMLRLLEEELNVPSTESIPINYTKKITEKEFRAIKFLGLFSYLVYVKNSRFFYYAIRHRMKPVNNTEEQVWGGFMSESLSLTRGDKLMKKKITFKDVAGLHEAKTEVFEFVKYLKNREIVQKLGAKPPTGALLLGPPGCGKTLLAKALASECDVPFYYMAATELIDMIVGVGASKVRQLFKNARENAPCIIYIDEIDAIGRVRGTSNQSDEQLLNQLLTELDGMNERNDVIILASTNRAEILDKALLRPGRFDRHIMIDLPTVVERTELFELYLNKLKLRSPVSTYASKLATLTPGMSGAEISNICNEAAIHAARVGHNEVSAADFEYAIERTIAGAAKSTNTLTYGEKKVIAYHEAGHAVVGWLLEHTDALLKVTIVPRTTNILGFAQYLPKENQLYSNEQLFEMMCMALGGRVAESIIFNKITNGAQDDLNRVTKIAYAQIKTFGMSKTVGLLSFPVDDEMGMKPFSKKYQNMLDIEARQLVGQAYRQTEEVIQKNIDKLHKVANLLLEKETISAAEIESLIGPPPFGKKNFIDPETLYDDELAKDIAAHSQQSTSNA